MPEQLSLRERRLAFGSVAQQYDRARPSYPPEVFDRVQQIAGVTAGDRVIEVGAGTGKATRALLQRGLRVTAVEPDAAMAELLERNCTGTALEVVHSDFESYRSRGQVRLIVSAQAWHWVDPARGFARAREALAPGGVLAVIWTYPDWGASALRDRLRELYRVHAPELAPQFPMHPGWELTDFGAGWRSGIASVEGFGEARALTHRWSARYTAGEYCEMVSTHQDHILLEPSRRAALLQALAAAIERAAGSMELVFQTFLGTAARE